ncbi:Cu/Ag efflux protein CusF [Mitsuaria sp. BK045]|uniref:copper-binding protein n=1 Tax=unclassified Roseateles TaxID=2626991 RepID=UPI00161BB9AE|nr:MULTISPECIES: copper-binding protein [unclassified Roseateles]MBB3295180.1 Cu/Ag efflux protein CusF [Mitsuaria sp. BK041]MBB3364396.1 Cu/Ag efflux protein CusF [Mitsuaria sp. BK045]
MNRFPTLLAAIALTLIAAASPARAQHQGHEGHEGHGQPAAAAAAPAASADATASSQDWIAAEVRRVDAAQQKLTLKHGEIRHLDMPGMTMPFKLAPGVLSAAQLTAMKAGDKVEVRIESRDGAPTIVELRPAPAPN